jgi:hypothetical protein
MTGCPESNYPAFHALAKEWRDKGYAVINPAELGGKVERTWQEYMKTDLRVLLECDSIVLMSGWSKSKGAQTELFVALQLGMKVYWPGGYECADIEPVVEWRAKKTVEEPKKEKSVDDQGKKVEAKCKHCLGCTCEKCASYHADNCAKGPPRVGGTASKWDSTVHESELGYYAQAQKLRSEQVVEQVGFDILR